MHVVAVALTPVSWGTAAVLPVKLATVPSVYGSPAGGPSVGFSTDRVLCAVVDGSRTWYCCQAGCNTGVTT